MFDEDRKGLTFKTEEAVKYVNELILKAWEYASDLSNKISKAKDKEEGDKIFNEVFDRIEKETSRFSVITDFVSDMLTGDCLLKSNECKLHDMGYRIVQCTIQ